MKADDIQQIPADTLLAEELAREDVIDMANLQRRRPARRAPFTFRRQWADTSRE
jgi:hypothetical protein